MAGLCVVCDGTGRLVQEVCPLCDGDPSFGEGRRHSFVFVLAGQSNMVGRGTGAEVGQDLVDYVQSHADVYMAYDIDKSATEQANTTSGREFLRLGRETQWSDGGKCYTHGPEWGIAQRTIELCIDSGQEQRTPPSDRGSTLKPRIYFIKFAMGSTSLHEDWSPDGTYFGEFTSFTKAMLRKAADIEGLAEAPRIDCMFWNQGDSDASGRAVMRDGYKANLVNFVQRVWEELAGPDAHAGARFPFVPLQLHWRVDEASKSTKKYRKSMDKVNEAIGAACQELGSSTRMARIAPEMELVLASLCHDDGHSGSAALVLEGRHLADTYLAEPQLSCG